MIRKIIGHKVVVITVRHAAERLMAMLVGVAVIGVAALPYTAATMQPVGHKKVPALTKRVHSPAAVTRPKTVPAPVSTAAKPGPAPAATVPVPAAAPVTKQVVAAPQPAPVIPAPNSNVSSLTPLPATATAPSTSTSPAGTSTSSPTSQQAAPAPAPVSYTSSNWSGYMATAGKYTAISGSWTATSPTGTGSSTSADAAWIGIGGVTSGDLIQVGTDNDVAADGTVHSEAFYELLPNVSQTVPGISVSPGDSMTASITEISPGQWTISIRDLTAGQAYTSTVAYSSTYSSAEWIEEDPSYASGQQIPFDYFGIVNFTGGTAVDGGLSKTISTADSSSITMVSHSGHPVAIPSALGSSGTSFSVTRN